MSKNESLIFSLNPSMERGMDYKELEKEGRDIIQKLSGASGLWTNYNISDPGITILEHLCYAITDLSYRLAFPVEDLLAEAITTDGVSKKKILFSAKEILAVSPVTLNDYRKLLIDIPGVKNAWFEVATDQIKGLYQVFIETNRFYTQEEISEKNVIIDKVKQKLHQNRNLCEDFYDITLLEHYEINVEVNVELQDNANIINFKEKLYKTVKQAISPEIPFYSFEELRRQGKTVEEIYEGPVLDHGFIVDEDLQKLETKAKIYIADIIEEIHKIPTVKVVRKFAINGNEEIVDNTNNNVFFISEFKVNFYKNGYLILEDAIAIVNNSDLQKKNTDLLLSSGRYRNLIEYNSIQNDFPHNYLLGKNNLADNNTNKDRIIKSKQLRAYLLIFDQILANSFADTNGIKTLFNYIEDLEETTEMISEVQSGTYSSQPVDLPDLESLVYEEYKDKLVKITQGISESKEQNEKSNNNRCIRKSRLLDYLLAIYGETFKDYSVAVDKGDNNKLLPAQKLINKKITCLTNYPKLSGLRGKAIDYTIKDRLDSKRTCPLQDSISNILDLADNEFYLIEHILLRPFASEETDIPLVINDASFYSYRISIIMPKSKIQDTFNIDLDETQGENLENTVLAKKIRQVSRNESPAHLKINYHIWNHDKITKFKEYYDDWIKAFADGSRLNIVSINSFIVTKILRGLAGIGYMVVGDRSIAAKNYYYFTVYDGTDPIIADESEIIRA